MQSSTAHVGRDHCPNAGQVLAGGGVGHRADALVVVIAPRTTFRSSPVGHGLALLLLALIGTTCGLRGALAARVKRIYRAPFRSSSVGWGDCHSACSPRFRLATIPLRAAFWQSHLLGGAA